MYLFNIFNETEDNDHIATILICLDTNPLLFMTNVGFLEHEKPLTYLQTLICIFGNIF